MMPNFNLANLGALRNMGGGPPGGPWGAQQSIARPPIVPYPSPSPIASPILPAPRPSPIMPYPVRPIGPGGPVAGPPVSGPPMSGPYPVQLPPGAQPAPPTFGAPPVSPAVPPYGAPPTANPQDMSGLAHLLALRNMMQRPAYPSF